MEIGGPRSSQHPFPLFIAGPTAVGKSEVAMILAKKLDGEIISVDSMQVYRGMDIGTAKASTSQRGQIPHHLLDILDVTQSFDAAQFIRLARPLITEIQGRKRVPILCGGTGLYFKALHEGLGSAPASNPELRSELESTPLSQLVDELSSTDPITFRSVDRHNLRRVIRAVEVIRLTGEAFSKQRATWNSSSAPAIDKRAFFLTRNTSDLVTRIDARVDAMFRDGLLAETRYLVELGLCQNPTASQAIGYRQIIEHLNGGRPLSETIALVKIRTRQFAKRQKTWFRRQSEFFPFEIQRNEPASTIADRIILEASAGEK